MIPFVLTIDSTEPLSADDCQLQLSLLSFGLIFNCLLHSSTCKSYRHLKRIMPKCELFLSSLQPAPPTGFSLSVKVVTIHPVCASQKPVSHSYRLLSLASHTHYITKRADTFPKTLWQIHPPLSSPTVPLSSKRLLISLLPYGYFLSESHFHLCPLHAVLHTAATAIFLGYISDPLHVLQRTALNVR